MNECVFIYRTYHIVSQGGLQFYLSEIGRQLVEAPLKSQSLVCIRIRVSGSELHTLPGEDGFFAFESFPKTKRKRIEMGLMNI